MQQGCGQCLPSRPGSLVSFAGTVACLSTTPTQGLQTPTRFKCRLGAGGRASSLPVSITLECGHPDLPSDLNHTRPRNWQIQARHQHPPELPPAGTWAEFWFPGFNQLSADCLHFLCRELLPPRDHCAAHDYGSLVS